jgi:hypothetical protein
MPALERPQKLEAIRSLAVLGRKRSLPASRLQAGKTLLRSCSRPQCGSLVHRYAGLERTILLQCKADDS